MKGKQQAMASTAEEGGPPGDEAIQSVVLEILKEADLESTTEFKVRKLASEKLGADLNTAAHKKLVRKIVEDYLSSQAEPEANPAEEEEAQDHEDNTTVVEDDDSKGNEKPQEESDNEADEAPRNKFSHKSAPAPKQRKQTFGDNEDQVICQLSNKRNVSIQNFRGKTLVSIREYYEKDGELRPGAKGISLSVDQWQVLKKNVSAIEKAIADLKS